MTSLSAHVSSVRPHLTLVDTCKTEVQSICHQRHQRQSENRAMVALCFIYKRCSGGLQLRPSPHALSWAHILTERRNMEFPFRLPAQQQSEIAQAPLVRDIQPYSHPFVTVSLNTRTFPGQSRIVSKIVPKTADT